MENKKRIIILVLIILVTSSLITFAETNTLDTIEIELKEEDKEIEEDKEAEEDNLIKIIFELNGGKFIEGFEGKLNHSREKGLDLSKYKLEKDNYEFIGWRLSKDGEIVKELKVEDYEEKESITLYPLFKEKEIVEKTTIKLNYYEDKVEEKEVTLEEINELLKEKPKRSGYKFLHWSLKESGEEIIEVKEKDIDNVEMLNIYAVWEEEIEEETEEKEFIVEFDSNGGTKVESKKVKEGNTLGEVETPIKIGYEFVSWQLNSEDFDFNKEINENLRLVAKWNKKINFNKLEEYNGEEIGKEGVILEIENNLLNEEEQDIWIIIKLIDEKGRTIHLSQITKKLKSREIWTLRAFYSNLPREKVSYKVYIWDGRETQNILEITPRELIIDYNKEVKL